MPKQLASEHDPVLVYEVRFSTDSEIVYSNHTIQANKCVLMNPCTVETFLTKYCLWIDALRHSGNMIRFYRGTKPEHLCIEAVKQNGLALQHIEEATEEVCLYAVHSNWESLQFVKEKGQTTRVCEMAIERCGKAIQYVRNLTPELCSLAIKHGGGVEFLQSMPLEVCRLAVERNGMFLKYIPEGRQTEDVCMTAIANNPYALEWVINPTEEMCLKAVSQNGRALKFVKVQTPAICIAAMANTQFALQYVKEYMLPKLCVYAEDNKISILSMKEEGSWRSGFVYGFALSIGVSVLIQVMRRV